MNTKRLESIDILKGLAMLMIILVHYNQAFIDGVLLFQFGQMGCQIFFVVSGFGIARLFMTKYKEQPFWCSVRRFYIARLKAIAPAWWLMIIVVLVSKYLLLEVAGVIQKFGSYDSFIGILCNVFFVHGFIPKYNNNVMPGGWYIGTTMLLYFIAPILYYGFLHFKNRKRLVCAITSCVSVLILLIIAIVFSEFEHVILNINSFGYYSILSQFPCFCMGMLLCFEMEEKQVTSKNALFSFVVGTVLILCAVQLFFNPFFKFSYIVTVSLVGLSAYYLLKAMIFYETFYKYPYVTKPIIKIGKISFFVYLTHAFFVWTFVSIVKGILGYVNLNSDHYFVYIGLLPIVILLSYISGVFLKSIVRALWNQLSSKFWD